jgi:hypothetical protein
MALLLRNSRMPQIKHRPTQFEQGSSVTLPAPYGGINLRDDITALKKNEARILTNWFPTNGQLSVRPGSDFWVGGMGTGEVKTLASFVGYSASALLAAANGKIYDASSTTYDPGNDQYTKVLLKFDGADAGTTITDSNAGGSSHTWSAAGNAQLDTAQKKFGLSSLLCDGTGDWVTVADHADFSLGSGDFTIDFWFNCDAASGSKEALAGQMASGLAANTGAWYMERHTTDVIRAHVSNGSALTTVTGTTAITATGQHHAALVRTGDVLQLYIDGVQEGGDVAFTGSVNNSANALRVGAAGEDTNDPWTGWVDEFRISVGTARWTEDFTAPTVPYAPPELAIGFTSDLWQTALYGDRLFFVNGADNPQVYNGTTVADIAWTGSGLTDNNLVNVALVRNRLWFCENSSADVWYANVGQITAATALTKFSLSQIASGGICMAVGSWSRDAGDGADDLTVFIMSTGEFLVYQGDPATTFALVGKYNGAPPVGRRCAFKVGGELVVITRLGYLPISAAISMPPGQALDLSAIDPWGKIAPGVVSDAATGASLTGWNATTHLGTVYANVPLSASTAKQWVLNTRTASWGNYTGWPASCFASFSNDLYFGKKTGGEVFKVTGATDNGTAITALASGAFVNPTNPPKTNLYTLARPRLQADGTMSGIISVDTDYVIRSLTGETANFSDATSGSAWETSAWETTEWGSEGSAIARWYSVKGEGKSVSARLSLTTSAGDCRWFATDIAFKPGGIR